MPGLILGTGQLDVDLLGPVAVGSASFGAVTATATAEVENLVVASAPLGGVLSSASSTVTTFATASSSFGVMVAEANTIPTPPIPEGAGAGVGMPNFVQPYFPPTQEVEKVIATATAVAMAKIPALKANALARIDFSILADDDEVLLLI